MINGVPVTEKEWEEKLKVAFVSGIMAVYKALSEEGYETAADYVSGEMNWVRLAEEEFSERIVTIKDWDYRVKDGILERRNVTTLSWHKVSLGIGDVLVLAKLVEEYKQHKQGKVSQ